MAFLHHVAAFTLVAALAVEFVLIRGELTAATARRLAGTDMILGISAGVLLAVGIRMYFARAGAALEGRVKIKDFRLGESSQVPVDVALPNRNLMNLLETPVLFYVVCIILFVTGKVDALALTLAWVYVALRVMHSVVHLTYNNVIHRLAAFLASNVILVALWARLVVAL